MSAAQEAVTANLVQRIDTSAWNPASPDPSGIAYMPDAGHFIVADSEVDETTGAGHTTTNIWEITPAGAVVATGNTQSWPVSPVVKEPTGLSYDPATNTLFVSNDDTERIYLVKRGTDNIFGTPDDVISQIDTSAIIQTAASDAEDPAFDPATGHLFFLNGQQTQVYRIDPVNGVFGDGDDTFTFFDFGSATATDAEALDIDAANGTLMVGTNGRRILEFTKDGTLLRTIEANGIQPAGLQNISGLALAPASDGSGKINFWIVDRGVDNDNTPTENDGDLFEITIPASITSVNIDNPTPKTNDLLTASVVADGNVSYQWLRNGVEIPGATGQTLDLSEPGNGDKGDWITLRAIASDGQTETAPMFKSVQVVNSSPILNLPDRTNSELNVVDVSLSASDPDGDALAYSATGLPAGLNLNPTTGQVTGIIEFGSAASSPFNVQFTVAEADSPAAPPITLVQRVTPTAPSASELTTTFSTVPTEGNLLVALVRVGSGRMPTMPAGWTEIGRGTGTPLAFAFYKFAGENEPQAVTMTVSGTATNANLSLFEYSGINRAPDQAIGSFVTSGPTSGVLSGTTGSITATTGNELLLAALHLGGSRGWDNAWTNGFTRLSTQATSTATHQSFAHLITSVPGVYDTTESWNVDPRTTSVATAFVSFRGLTSLPSPDPVVGGFEWTVRNAVATAAPVSVSGRVVNGIGRGVYGAVVYAHDQHGQTWIARTNSFGYFQFFELPSGETYVFSVSAKRFRFLPQVMSVQDQLTGLNFVADQDLN